MKVQSWINQFPFFSFSLVSDPASNILTDLDSVSIPNACRSATSSKLSISTIPNLFRFIFSSNIRLKLKMHLSQLLYVLEPFRHHFWTDQICRNSILAFQQRVRRTTRGPKKYIFFFNIHTLTYYHIIPIRVNDFRLITN